MITELFDLPILDWIAQNLWNPVLDGVIPTITHLGDAGAVWILLALVLLCTPKYRKAGLSMAAALLIGLVVCNLTLKPLVARMRPFDYQLLHFGKEIPLLISPPTDFSFPSGHTNASFAAATALLLYNRKLGIPSMVLAALIAFSRLYLYVHYPTDVLASIVLGACAAFVAKYLVNKGYALYQIKKHKGVMTMSNKAIHTPNAPAAIGPYSQGVTASGNITFVSGQLPINPATGEFAGADIASQTRQSLTNIKAILEANGMTMADVVKTTVLLEDISEFAAMNAVYAEFFTEPYPARAAYQVAALPKAAKIEIEAIAVK